MKADKMRDGCIVWGWARLVSRRGALAERSSRRHSARRRSGTVINSRPKWTTRRGQHCSANESPALAFFVRLLARARRSLSSPMLSTIRLHNSFRQAVTAAGISCLA